MGIVWGLAVHALTSAADADCCRARVLHAAAIPPHSGGRGYSTSVPVQVLDQIGHGEVTRPQIMPDPSI